MLSFLQGLHAHLPVSPWIILLGAIVSYHVVRSIYLIYFSPLSIFPGSKWAAIGEYWEAYWNIGVTPGRKGQTLFKLEKMHHELGPAIRLGPNEVHVYDPNFYHELYRSGSRYYKDPQMHKVFGAPSSTVAECDPAKHKVRRAPLESLFAKVNTNKLEPSLLRNLDVLSQRFDSMYAAGKPISMEWALKSLTMDTVSQFIFGKSFNAMGDPDFKALPVRVFTRYLMNLHVIKAFPFVRHLSNLPLWLAKLIAEDVANGHELERVTSEKIDEFIADKEKGKLPAFPTAMERLLISIPEKGYIVPSKLGIRDEVLTLLSAGNDTTGITTTVTLFNVIHNPAIHSRLLAELKTVMPKPDSNGPYLELEKLPYLSAVVKEGLRYASPAASRTPRLVPSGGVKLPDGRFIPEGTRVGMSIYHVHYNESLFANPREFDPERWLKPSEEIAEQNKFMVAFSRGSRSCIGINLAYMELYMFVAHLLRRFEFISAGTTEKDMLWDDMVIPQFHGEFKVMAKRRVE